MKELTQNENTTLVMKICEFIDSKKGEAIEIFDISKQSREIDFMVVATASNTTLTKGISDYVELELKKLGTKLLRRDGVNNWIVLDFNQILVHIFTPEIRDFYHLDKIWSNGKNIFRFDDIKKAIEKENKLKKAKVEKEKLKTPEKEVKKAKEKSTEPKKKEEKKENKAKTPAKKEVTKKAPKEVKKTTKKTETKKPASKTKKVAK